MLLKNTGKVLAFFGSDLQRSPEKTIRAAYDAGYNLIALDTEGIAIADAENLPFTLIDDWVDSEAMLQAKKDASVWEKQWFEDAREEFTVNGICWPEFDREAMYWFWLTVSISNAFLDSIVKHGIKEIRCFQSESLRPAVYYWLSDVHAIYWKAYLGSRADKYAFDVDVSVRINKETKKYLREFKERLVYSAYAIFRENIKKVRSYIFRYSDKKYDLSLDANLVDIAGKVLIAINPDEAYRVAEHIRRINKKFNGRVVIVILSNSQRWAAELAANFSMPVFCTRSLVNSDDTIVKNSFHKGYGKIIKTSKNYPWNKALKFIKFHFDYYFNKRWPALNATFEYWYNLLKNYRPLAVVVSTLEDSESQLPAGAANKLSIPTFSIPHGVCVTRDTRIKTKYVICNFEADREGYIRSGISPEGLIGCRDYMTINEYPVNHKYSLLRDKGKWNILVLTIPIGRTGCLFPVINPGDQIKALRIIDSPPSDIADKLSVKIKVHPGYSDIEIITKASKRLLKNILPLDFELRSALEISDLVVALNYSGVAVIHAVQENKPIIHFWVDQCIGRADPFVYADIYLPSGALVRDADNFWDTVRRFFTEGECAEALLMKSQKFRQEKLNDRNFPKLEELIYEKLESEFQVSGFK